MFAARADLRERAATVLASRRRRRVRARSPVSSGDGRTRPVDHASHAVGSRAAAGSARRRRVPSRRSAAAGTRSARPDGSRCDARGSRTRTETAPYAFVPGSAKNRSATSRCTITHQRRRADGRPPASRRRAASRRCRAGWRRACGAAARAPPRSTRERVAEDERDVLAPPIASRSGRSSDRSSSTACTWRTRSARKRRQHAEPRPDLEDDVVGRRAPRAARSPRARSGRRGSAARAPSSA